MNPLILSPPQPGRQGLGEGRLYAALSCIGANLKVWNNIAVEKEHGVEYLNSDGIKHLTRVFMAEYMKKHAVEGKMAWFMDQGLGSELINKYCERYGWHRVHGRDQKLDEQGRVDRAHLSSNRWFEVTGYSW